MGKLNWALKTCAGLLLCATTAVALPAQTFNTLHSFDNADGANPSAVLAQGTDGNFYGTTQFGGANDTCAGFTCGTVFKITPSGVLTILHSFDTTDGYELTAGLVLGTDGNFYGTTQFGGATGVCTAFSGCGTVFKITAKGILTTLHSFNFTDGSEPHAGLIQAANGDFYGTTLDGGDHGFGTVFKITSSGALTTLYSFCSQSDCTDGSGPSAGLVQGTDGNFYGTTAAGGSNGGYGTVFKITANGTLTTLHSFDDTDGANPQAALIQGSDGNFYGTTENGGSNVLLGMFGTVFKITPNGALTMLYSFCPQNNGCPDGAFPFATLVQATDGDFYGTTLNGGSTNNGTAFKITPSGTLTTLHSFDSLDGSNLRAGVVQATNGKFYGTASDGGTGGCTGSGCGTIFSLSVDLAPFVETLPASGRVGARVKILGTNLTGTTSVRFNGTAATFTVKSKSEITTTVPIGATTGKVKVATPPGTLTSKVAFRVNP